MRELLIKRIEELWPLYGNVRMNPKDMRWRNVFIDDVHISKIDLSTASDEIVMRVFERFIRRCQTTM